MPDIVVEVNCPNDLVRDVDLKRDEWLRAGAKEVWVVSPDAQAVQVFRAGGAPRFLREHDTLTSPELLPGFAVPVADLFRLPAPQAPAAAGE